PRSIARRSAPDRAMRAPRTRGARYNRRPVPSEVLMLRSCRGIPLAVLAAVVLPSPSSAQAVRHPLDALTPQEYWTAFDVLRDSGQVDDKTRYATVRLNPPPKADVLRWQPGQA